MKNVAFKFQNRDVVIVTGINNAEEAFDAANDFLADIEDENNDYVADSKHSDFKDDGSIEFHVKCYSK